MESGIKSGQQLIVDWRNQFADIYSDKDDADQFLQEQRWYGHPEEYSVLFETLFDQPSLRREFIESLIKDANPSWGYVYLVNMIRARVFNTVFTTNFDDLLNEACYLFSTDIRPIVCSHDSSIRSIRVFSKRPKIIKLHGDFLFDSIKNTVKELENLENNMREKFRQCAGEFGLIVMGYGGNDRSVMDTLDALLRNDDYFPHGIYWCVHGNEIPTRVDELTRFSNFHVVNINGFDDFFAMLNSQLALGTPIQDPYVAVKDRLKSLISALPVPQPWQQTTSQLHTDIRTFCDSLIRSQQDEFVTNEIRCNIHYKRGDYAEAARDMLRALRSSESLNRETYFLKTCLRCCVDAKDDTLKNEILEALTGDPPALSDVDAINDGAVELISLEDYDFAKKLLEFLGKKGSAAIANIAFVNLVQIKIHTGKNVTKKETEKLEELSNFGMEYRMCCLTLLGKGKEFVDELLGDSKWPVTIRRRSVRSFLGWPIAKLLPKSERQRLDKFLVPNVE